MLFNSFEFLIFLPIVFLAYWLLSKKALKMQNGLILIASYYFYGWWSWKFMGLLALCTFLDYIYGFAVANPNKSKAKIFLWLSIINNLGILAVFKYYNFFAKEFSHLISLFGLSVNPIILEIGLPVGISFYTFHGMSYIFDIYRGEQKPVKSFIDYAVFVSFFPLLVAGPIERAGHLLPQIQKLRKFNYRQATEGCRLILWGLFKKVVIADSLSPIVDTLFANYNNYDAYSLIIGAIAFSFQIYGDFSGYSDIALGTAKLFGFELLSNFKFPYFSRNIAEFWRRWHISLSSWFKDYLYIPLGGSKNGKIKAIRNTFIIFVVSGFWHGASWNFIIWGALHACAFLPFLIMNENRKYLNTIVAVERHYPNLKELFQMLLTFGFVTLTWIFFRANDLTNAIGYLNKIISGTLSEPEQFLMIPKIKIPFFYIIPLVVGDWILRKNERQLIVFKNKYIRYIFYVAFTIIIFLFFGKSTSTFIYFQF